MAAPPKPAPPALAASSPSTLRVRWSPVAASPPVESWSLRSRTAAGSGGRPPAGPYRTVTGLDAGAAALTLTELAAGARYEVSVRAANSDGGSTWSDPLTVSTQEEDVMPILQRDLSRVASGAETTAGTPAAATRTHPYTDGSWSPMEPRKTLEEAGGVLADTTDVVVGRGTDVSLTEELSPEMVLPAFLASLAAVTPAADASSQLWTFTPSVSSPSGLRTFTWEVAATDGANRGARYERRCSHALCTSWSITAGGGGETAQIRTEWKGRAEKDLPSPAAAAVPPRWIIPAQAFSLFVDDSWATVGTTLLGVVRQVTLEFDPGLAAAEMVAGRADLDLSYFRRGRLGGKLTALVDHDETTGPEVAHWRANELRYFRLHAGNGASGAAARSLTVDFVGRYIDGFDVLASADGVLTLDLAADLRADDDKNILRATVRNGIAAW